MAIPFEKLDDGVMTQLIPINLRTVEDVKEFNRTASNLTVPVTLVSSYYRIDAKSLFGILSLDLSKTVYLEISSDKAFEFRKWMD